MSDTYASDPIYLGGIPSNRLEKILAAIPRAPARISVKTLCERIGMEYSKSSQAMLNRDLKELLRSKPNLKLAKKKVGKENEWFFAQGAPVQIIPSMDDHTALAFQLASLYLRDHMAPDTIHSLEPFLKEAGKRLSSRNGVASWKDKIYVSPLGLKRVSPIIRSCVRDVVYSAILNERAIRIEYHRRGETEMKSRIVSPLGLVIRDYILYVVCYHHENGKIPYQPLQRIRCAVIADGETFVRPDGFSLSDYVDQNMGFQYKGSSVLDLKLRIGKQSTISVTECRLAGQQRLYPDPADPECSIVEALVPNSLELRQWIRALGPRAEVLAPKHLRLELAEEIEQSARRYGVVT